MPADMRWAFIGRSRSGTSLVLNSQLRVQATQTHSSLSSISQERISNISLSPCAFSMPRSKCFAIEAFKRSRWSKEVNFQRKATPMIGKMSLGLC